MGIISTIGLSWIIINAIIFMYKLILTLIKLKNNFLFNGNKAGAIIYKTNNESNENKLEFKEISGKVIELKNLPEIYKKTKALPELHIFTDIRNNTTEDAALAELMFITSAIYDVLNIAILHKAKAKVKIVCNEEKNSPIGSGMIAYYYHLVTIIKEEKSNKTIDISLTHN